MSRGMIGYPWAFVLLLLFLAEGGCVSDSAKIDVLEKKALGGDASAQFELAVAYDRGVGVPADLSEAANWYRKAAEQGHTDAQNSLGSLYQAGQGVPKDYVEAVKWYRKAAEMGHATGKNNLAYMYDIGLGVPEDNQLAAKSYREAAELGEVRAMLNLGILYTQGQGVEKDYIEAYKWLDLARFLTQRSRDRQLKWRSRGALDELRKEMTPPQIAEGQRRSSEWLKAQRSK